MLCRSRELSLISSYFTSKEADFLVIFKVALSNNSRETSLALQLFLLFAKASLEVA